MSQELPKGERTRLSIVQAAHDLFCEQGYHGTSMRQIAEQAGIALGGIYNHFGSKEDIFFEVLISYHPLTIILPALENVQAKDSEGIIREIGAILTDHLNTRNDFINLLFIEVVEFNTKHISQLIPIIYPLVSTFTNKIQQNEDSTIRDLPIPIIIFSFVGQILSFAVINSFKNVASEHVEMIDKVTLDHFLDIYLRGILKEEP